VKCLAIALPVALLAAANSVSTNGTSSVAVDPMHFFTGGTEAVGTMKIVMQKLFVTRSWGRGKISPDGSLQLVQHVKEEGRREFDRRWQIRQIAPGRFTGTMTEAKGPVTIEKIGGRYRFRFAMNGSLAVEEWITPQPDTTRAQTQLTIRKFGIIVVHGEGWIRKTDSAEIGSVASSGGASF
jgi:hypothetical protein